MVTIEMRFKSSTSILKLGNVNWDSMFLTFILYSLKTQSLPQHSFTTHGFHNFEGKKMEQIYDL